MEITPSAGAGGTSFHPRRPASFSFLWAFAVTLIGLMALASLVAHLL